MILCRDRVLQFLHRTGYCSFFTGVSDPGREDVEFGRFRPAEVVYDRRDFINFGEAPTMEEEIHRPKQVV
ncbi:unnamed protein product [Heligmosomoides polygyrus]|uniref:Cytochrome P450 n=1 Tax=Heligmosomoides polygyrus TaxID=6339 RepID=A0A183FWV4_HELPZ|nr:unnamed protein product [Heligmosomoides polygyrus]